MHILTLNFKRNIFNHIMTIQVPTPDTITQKWLLKSSRILKISSKRTEKKRVMNKILSEHWWYNYHLHIAPVQQQSWAHGLQLLYISRQPIWAQNLIRNKLCVSSKFDSTFNGGPSCYKCSKSCCLTLFLVLCLFFVHFSPHLKSISARDTKILIIVSSSEPTPWWNAHLSCFVKSILFCSVIDWFFDSLY